MTTIQVNNDVRFVRKAIVLGAMALLVLTFVAYIPVLSAGFIWDDDDYVTTNIYLRSLEGLKLLWIPGTTKQYYPLVFTTFWIEYQLWELRPMGYHVVNVMLHAANSILVFMLCVRLRIPPLEKKSAALLAAWIIAAAFAVHPVHVESVAWITERKNVLSGLFYLAAMIAYLNFDENHFEDKLHSRQSHSLRWYFLSLLLFVGALLSKTVTCSLPVALLLILFYQRRLVSVKRIFALAPMFAIGLLLALHTAALERNHVGAMGADFAFSIGERILIAARALLFYPEKLLWPHPLMFIYPRWIIDMHSIIAYLPLIVIIFSPALAIVLNYRGYRGPIVAPAFYACTIFPALGFFNIYPMLFSFVADHFQYLASLGILALCVGGVAYRLNTFARIAWFGCAMLSVFALLTWNQSQIYFNAESVWRDTLLPSKNPNAWMPLNNLGSILIQKAEAALSQNDAQRGLAFAKEAEEKLRKALELRPGHYPALSNLSEALRLQGRYSEALAPAEQTLQHDPNSAENHWLVGRLLQLLHRNDEAIAEYQLALLRDPNDALVRRALANLFATSNRLNEAAPHFLWIVQHEPNDVNALVILGDVADQNAQYAQAEEYYKRAFDAAGNDPQLILHAGYRLARFWVRCKDPSYRNGANALQIADQLCQMTNRTSPYLLDVLADALAANGRMNEAIETATEARDLAKKAKLDSLATEIDERIQRYRSPQ